MLWLLKLVTDDAERNKTGGAGDGFEVWNSSKLPLPIPGPVQEYGGGIIVLACNKKSRPVHMFYNITVCIQYKS